MAFYSGHSSFPYTFIGSVRIFRVLQHRGNIESSSLTFYLLDLSKREETWQSFSDKRSGLAHGNYSGTSTRWRSVLNRSLNDFIADGARERCSSIKSTATDHVHLNTRPKSKSKAEITFWGRKSREGLLDFAVTRATAGRSFRASARAILQDHESEEVNRPLKRAESRHVAIPAWSGGGRQEDHR